MNILALANNQYAIPLKDYWVIITAFFVGAFFVIKYISKTVIRINKIPDIETNVENLQKEKAYIKGKLNSIEKLLKNMLSGAQVTTTIARTYGEAHSPVALKDEYKEFITTPKLDEQIIEKNDDLLAWLKEQKPKTGLDAQEDIVDFVVSHEVSKYLDLTDYRQYLYRRGKTSQDANGILGVYLFEALIPQLDISDGEEKKKTKSKS